MEAFEVVTRQGGDVALRQAASFFMQTDPVHRALRTIARRLDELRIPYAVAGGMALVAHGYDRTTVDVDILLTPEGMDRARQALEGLGYVPPFAGSKNPRHTATGVRIRILLVGSATAAAVPYDVPHR